MKGSTLRGADAMFFLLRCFFWLGVVFLSIDWPQDAGQKIAEDILPMARRAVAGRLERAGDELVRACAKAPETCVNALNGFESFDPGEKSAAQITGSSRER
jgi:hypothetical protein